ncbi:MAG: hypothetical protein IKH57_19150 [Clostridia bacterium]|nr:hypothetical protein [Clostridia bacterium]
MRRVFRCFGVALCVLCLAAGMAMGVSEETGGETIATYSRIYDYAVVEGTDKLNMRIGPGPNYDWVGSALLGEWVGVLGEQEYWVYAYIPQMNQYGYMAKTYLVFNNETGVPGEGVVHNPQAGAKTALHSFPAYQAQVVKTVDNGASLSLISASVDGWYEVEIDGERGFLRCETVKITQALGAKMEMLQAPGSGKILMRDRPYFLGSQVVGSFSAGNQAGVLVKSSVGDAFWKVVVNGQVGYVLGRFVAVDDESDSNDLMTAKVTAQNREALNIRLQPSAKARVIGRCTDEELKVIAVGEDWSKVYGGENHTVGYCRTDCLDISQNPGLAVRKVSGEDAYLYVNLRSGHAVKSGVPVPMDAEVTVLTPGDTWCEVRFAGTMGYMKTASLQ